MTKKKKSSMADWLKERIPEALVMDGFDSCIMGVCQQCGKSDIIAYDRRKVEKLLMKQGMSEDEAVEFLEFNQLGSWVGEMTPCFIEKKPDYY